MLNHEVHSSFAVSVTDAIMMLWVGGFWRPWKNHSAVTSVLGATDAMQVICVKQPHLLAGSVCICGIPECVPVGSEWALITLMFGVLSFLVLTTTTTRIIMTIVMIIIIIIIV